MNQTAFQTGQLLTQELRVVDDLQGKVVLVAPSLLQEKMAPAPTNSGIEKYLRQ